MQEASGLKRTRLCLSAFRSSDLFFSRIISHTQFSKAFSLSRTPVQPIFLFVYKTKTKKKKRKTAINSTSLVFTVTTRRNVKFRVNDVHAKHRYRRVSRAARVGRDRKRKRLVARCGTRTGRRRRRRSRSSVFSLVDSLGKVARTENNERKKRPCVYARLPSVSLSLCLSPAASTTSTEWALAHRDSGELELVDSGAPGVDALKGSLREYGTVTGIDPRLRQTRARRGKESRPIFASHRRRPRRRQRFPVGRLGVPRHGDARRLLTREGAKGRTEEGRGSFFRSRTSRSLPLVPPEYPTLRSQNAVSSPGFTR